MNVVQLAEKLGAKALTGTDEALEAEVTGGCCGDLLSWVMGSAQAGDAWVTIMSNPNVAAVAHLSGVACVVLAEGVVPDDGLLARASVEDIPLLRSDKGAFELCGLLYGFLRG